MNDKKYSHFHPGGFLLFLCVIYCSGFPSLHATFFLEVGMSPVSLQTGSAQNPTQVYSQVLTLKKEFLELHC